LRIYFKYVELKIKECLNARLDSKNIIWKVTTDHIEHVKSYGPRVDHLVLDVVCIPIAKSEKLIDEI
jgi:hypothetical protein